MECPNKHDHSAMKFFSGSSVVGGAAAMGWTMGRFVGLLIGILIGAWAVWVCEFKNAE